MVIGGEIFCKVTQIGIWLSKKFIGIILTLWFPSFSSVASVKPHVNLVNATCFPSIKTILSEWGGGIQVLTGYFIKGARFKPLNRVNVLPYLS